MALRDFLRTYDRIHRYVNDDSFQNGNWKMLINRWNLLFFVNIFILVLSEVNGNLKRKFQDLEVKSYE